MANIHEQFSAQFARFEKPGRGWQVFDQPVSPEPPFQEFRGYSLDEALDDGRRPTFLSSLLGRVRQKLSTQSPTLEHLTPSEAEPDPEEFFRTEILELNVSVPSKLNVNADSFAPILYSLEYVREPIAFELLGLPEDIRLSFAGNPGDMRSLERTLQSHVPEATLMLHDSVLQAEWERREFLETAVVEFGLERPWAFPVATNTHDIFIDVAAVLGGLDEGELGLFQVLFAPVQNDWRNTLIRALSQGGKPLFVNAPELYKSAERKVASPLFGVVVRIASKARTFDRAWDIASKIASAMGSFRDLQGNELIPLTNDDYPYEKHVGDVPLRQSHRSGMILNQDELLGFVHLPTSAVRAEKFRRDGAKTKRLPKHLEASSGLFLGTNEHAGVSLPVYLTPDQRVRHMHVIGTSGTGKSTFLFNCIRDDIEHGEGLSLLDPHGDLTEQILNIIPENRIEDVILFDPSDEEYSIGFNILSAFSDAEKNLLASDLVSVFQRLSTSWGDQMGSVLNNAILAFLESSQGGTLADVRRFLLESDFRKDFLKTVQDSEVIYYWEKAFPQLTGNKSIGPVLTRLESFLAPKSIRYMVSQKENRLNFSEIFDTKKIFLAKLSQGVIGRENAYLLGSLIMAKFQQTAMARQRQKEQSRSYFWIYCDECHNFITPSIGEILTGARKYRTGLVLAHQELRQLQRDPEVGASIQAAHTRIVFRTTDADARSLEQGFSSFEARDFQNLPTGQAICRIERSDFDFNLSIKLPKSIDLATAEERTAAIVQASRVKYGTARSIVEAVMRTHSAEEPRKASAPSQREQQAERDSTAPGAAPLVPRTIDRAEESNSIQSESPEAEVTEKEHESIKRRIRAEAETLDYTVRMEEKVLDGDGRVDVVLERGALSIACEIAITTTIDHEVGNVSKCLRAGFRRVAVIGLSKRRLSNIEQAVKAAVSSADLSLIGFYSLADFISKLREWSEEDPRGGATERSKSRKQGINLISGNLNEGDRRAREKQMLAELAQRMKKTQSGV